MQVSCFGFDWAIVERYEDTESLVDEIIMSDRIDDHAVYLPDGMWLSDGWTQHFEAAEELEALSGDAVIAVREVIPTGEAVDELGMCDLTEGCNFLSVSPDTVRGLSGQFESFCAGADFAGLSDDTRQWVAQWADAFSYFASRSLGVIGHIG